MKEHLDREMASYYTEFHRMLRENEICQKAGRATYYEVQRSKTLYRRIAKLIHPDINPEIDRQEQLQLLWHRTQIAYGHNDVKGLSELEVLVRTALKDLGAEEIRVEISDIGGRIKELKREIREIMETEPYTYKNIMDDPEAIQKKKEKLTEELAAYTKYCIELDSMIENLVQNGGVKIRWQMN